MNAALPRMWRRTLVALWLLLFSNAEAHEIGTTQVQLILHRDHTWTASITTAPTALINRLEAGAGEPLSRKVAAELARARLAQFAGAIGEHIDVEFDGVRSPPVVSLERIEMPADIRLPAFVKLRAEGRIGEGAKTVVWRYGLVYVTYAVTVVDETGGGRTETMWLEGDTPSQPFSLGVALAPPTGLAIVWQYLRLGFLHILPEGLDHILFVLGIFLLTTRLRPILTQVTAFTVAHSVTLGLTMYGIVALSPRIVEPLIALSVAYVAIENIMTSQLTPWRPAVVFCFGLLHGMGFAGVLTALRLPRGEIIPALISFNVGIELAQLSVIAMAFFAVAFWFRERPWYRSRITVPASAAIAAVGLLWTVQRVIQS